MKKKLLILLLISSELVFSQTYEWTRTTGSNSLDWLTFMGSDTNGNTYSTGIFNGTVDFDPGTEVFNLSEVGDPNGTSPNFDMFLQKYDQNGNFIWAISMGGIENDDARSLAVNKNGDVIVTGRIQNESNDGDDIYINKYDSLGNLIFSKTYGNNSLNAGKSIVTDSMDNIYILGGFRNTMDFDASTNVFNLTSSGDEDVFIQKLDTDGNFIWTKSFGGTNGDVGRSLNIDTNGNLYIYGGFSGTSDFDPGSGVSNLTAQGSFDAFIVKLNNNGELIWNKRIRAGVSDERQSITIDLNENIYITGSFESTIDFDPNSTVQSFTSNGEEDIFLLKLNSNGDFVWNKSFGGPDRDFGRSLTVDPLGDIYLSSIFNGTLDVDPGSQLNNLTSNGDWDILIQKFSSDGSLLWFNRIGGSGPDYCTSIILDNIGDLYLGGYFQSTVDFNPEDTEIDNFTSNGSSDIFISKFSQNLTLSIDEFADKSEKVTIYPNPTDTHLAFSSEQSLQINEVDIFDISGRLIKNFRNNTNSINIGNLLTGIYIVKIYTENQIITKKIKKI